MTEQQARDYVEKVSTEQIVKDLSNRYTMQEVMDIWSEIHLKDVINLESFDESNFEFFILWKMIRGLTHREATLLAAVINNFDIDAANKMGKTTNSASKFAEQVHLWLLGDEERTLGFMSTISTMDQLEEKKDPTKVLAEMFSALKGE